MTSLLPSPRINAPWACGIGNNSLQFVTTGFCIPTDKPGTVITFLAGHSLPGEDNPRWSNRTAAFGFGWNSGAREAYHIADLVGGVVHPRYSLPSRDIAICLAHGYPPTANRLHLPDARTPGYKGKQGTMIGFPQSAQKDRKPDMWSKVVTITADAGSSLEFRGEWEHGTSGGPLVVYDAARGRMTALGLFSQVIRGRAQFCRLEPLVPWIRETAARWGVVV